VGREGFSIEGRKTYGKKKAQDGKFKLAATTRSRFVACFVKSSEVRGETSSGCTCRVERSEARWWAGTAPTATDNNDNHETRRNPSPFTGFGSPCIGPMQPRGPG